jgi:protein O-mannosyl-transferase
VGTLRVSSSKSSKVSLKHGLESQRAGFASPNPKGVPGWVLALLVLLSVASVWAAYSNHFHNSFHFDDDSVIENNVYLRSLRNIPLFFQSATTFSSMPTNATYRPLTSVSFALDYRWGGLNPFAFHVTQWSLHLLMGVLLFFFLKRILDLSGMAVARRDLLSLFGAALFALHRANTETVNFLTLRSEILSSLGVVGSFVVFQYAPRWRKSFVWLVPAIAGAFAKQSAIIFVLLFALYLAIFPEELEPEADAGTSSARSWRLAMLWLLPSLIFAVAFYGLQDRLAGPRTVYGSMSPWVYLQTQTFAWLHYVRLFLIPLGQSADADWTEISHWYDTRVFAGVFFVALLFALAWRWARESSLGRAFLFGLGWFYVALIPSSSLFPLSELINEHRPYVAYPGLVLCLVIAMERLLVWIDRAPERVPLPHSRALIFVAAALLLAAHAFGTHSRNRVWLNEETLWKDVTEASPGNGRAWMNYGLIFMARADFQNARHCFERAQSLTPNYDILEINLGILDSATNQSSSAESHFRRAVALNQRPSVANLYYARWLREQKRDPEAIAHLKQALQVSLADLEARHLLMTIYAEMKDQTSLCSLASETLRIAPGDAATAQAARGCSDIR